MLVVEDNGSIGGLVAALLRQDGYRVVRAWDAKEAARLVRGRAPQLVVLDLALNYPDGVESLRTLHALAQNRLPGVVVVTATSVTLDEEESLVQEVVKKPFDIDVLLNAVRRGLNEPLVDVEPRQYDGQDYFLHGY